MNADLMGTTCLQDERDEAVPIFFFQHPVVGYGPFSMLKIHTALNNGTALAAKGSVDGALRRQDRAAHHRKILPKQFRSMRHGKGRGTRKSCGIQNGSFGSHEIAQDAGADIVLSDNGESGGVPVQAANTAKDKGLPLFLIIMGQGICQGIVAIVLGGVGGHARRLIHYKKILVFVEDLQGKGHGENML